MRMRLRFELEHTSLPSDYRVPLISFFKKSLTEYNDGALYDTYYAPAAYKPFTFAPFLYGPKFDKDKLDVAERRLDLVWSTGDMAVGIDFYNAFHQQLRKDFPLPNGNGMRLQKILLEHEQVITTDKTIVEFLSPLCVRSHNKGTNKDVYLSPERDGFEQECKEVVANQVKDILPEQVMDSFAICPLQTKKAIIRYHNGMLETSLGKFRLEGTPELLFFLYQYGIGSRRSAGFGCFSILM